MRERIGKITGYIKAHKWYTLKRAKLVAGGLSLLLMIFVIGMFTRTQALTGTVRPDGEITTGFALTAGTSDGTCSGAAGHCTRIDEATVDINDYVGTGTNNTNGGEVEEFTMSNSGLSTPPTVSSVTVYFHAATAACVNTSTACDRLIVSISMDNGGSYTATQTFNMTTTPTTYSATFNGPWTGIDGLRVRISRQVVLSTGPGNANDDDVRLYQMYATYDYTSSTTMEQAAYRWFNNPSGGLTAFDSDGVVQSNPTTGTDAGYHIASDGTHMYIVGYASSNGNDWRIEKRKLSDGSTENAFDTDGVLEINPGANDDRPLYIVVDGDYIYIGGYQSIASGNTQWRVEKRNKTTGALCSDTTNCPAGAFDGDGVYNFNYGSIDDQVYSLVVDGDYLFIGGYSGIGSGNADWRLEKRHKVTGAICSNTTNCPAGAFDTDGVLDHVVSSGSDVIYPIYLANGYLYIAGTDGSLGSSNGQVRIEKRHATTGAICSNTTNCPEGTFDGDGILLINPTTGNDAPGFSGLLVNSGYIFISVMQNNSASTSLQKFNAVSGAICSSGVNCAAGAFDTDGQIDLSYSGALMTFSSVTTDGTNIYWGGHDRSQDGGFSRWNIRKYLATSGAAVTAFGSSGEVLSNPSTGHDEVRGVTMDSDNLYITGYDNVAGNFQFRTEKRNLTSGALADSAQGATVGSALAAQDTAATGLSQGQSVRLRMLVHIGGDTLPASTGVFKLQYAVKSTSCDTSFSGETYRDITSSTPISYFDNTGVANGASVVTNANDPSHSGHTKVNEAYTESNNVDVPTLISSGQDGLWDFSLAVASNAPLNDYCIRLVHSDGSTFNTYTQVAELGMAPSISSISPNNGPTTGGTPFTITGNFGPSTTVTIGGVAATNVFTVSSTTIIGITPAGTAGAKNVVVTNGSSTATLTNGFTYSSVMGAYTNANSTDFTKGTLTNLRNGQLKIDEGYFQWRDFTPSATGGSMATGTYYYAVTALDKAGNETTRSVESASVAVTGPNGSVSLKWRPIIGAYGYKVYRTTTSGTYGASSLVISLGTAATSTANSLVEFVDTYGSTVSGQPPATNNTVHSGLFLDKGTVPSSGQGTMTTGPTVIGTAANTVRGGAHFIERPNGTYLLVLGNDAGNTSIYDPSNNTFSAGPALGCNATYGSHSNKLPNGNYLVICSNSATTRYYDPVNNTFSAGPNLTGNALWGATTIPLDDGNWLIIHGNDSTLTSYFNTSTLTMSSGPALASRSYVGQHAMRRPDGKWFMVQGGDARTNVYDPVANSFTSGNSLTAGALSGARSILRPNGTWIIYVGAGSSTTNIYHPVTGTLTAGTSLPTTMHGGGSMIERPDGKWLITIGQTSSGATSNLTYIYDPVADSYTAGPNLTAVMGEDSAWIQRPDGKFLIVHGNGTATSSIYDAGWLVTGGSGNGTYETEAIRPDQGGVLRNLSFTSMNTSNLLVEYRVATSREGLASASYTAMPSGINSAQAANMWVQYRVTFSRTPTFGGTGLSTESTGVWGLRGSKAPALWADPSLQSVSVIHDIIPNSSKMRHSKFFRSEVLNHHSTE